MFSTSRSINWGIRFTNHHKRYFGLFLVGVQNSEPLPKTIQIIVFINGFPDFLYPLAKLALILVLMLDYRRRKRENNFRDYDNLTYAYIGIAFLSMTIILAVIMAVYDLHATIMPVIQIVKQVLTVVMLGYALWYFVRYRQRVAKS